MGDLTKLIARVEALTGPDRLTDANILWAVNPEAFESDAGDDNEHLKPSYCYARGLWTLNRADLMHLDSIPVPRLTASIDAAVMLTERMLPGSGASIWYSSDGKSNVSVGQVGFDWGPHLTPLGSAEGPTPAIALILATLKALAAKEVEG